MLEAFSKHRPQTGDCLALDAWRVERKSVREAETGVFARYRFAIKNLWLATATNLA
jgi:hypothetical protein